MATRLVFEDCIQHSGLVAAGLQHAVLIRSDGLADGVGIEEGHSISIGFHGIFCNQYDVPGLPDGLSYVKVAAGKAHTILIRSDGNAVAIGSNRSGQC